MDNDAFQERGPRSREALLIIMGSLYWIWWDSFHETSRLLFVIPDYFMDGSVYVSYLSCAMKSVGLVIGGIIICFVLKRNTNFFTQDRSFRLLLYAEVLVSLVYFVFVNIFHIATVAAFLHAAVSACAAFRLAYFGMLLNDLKTSKLLVVLVGAVVSYAIMSNLVFAIAAFTIPLWAIDFAVTGCLIGSCYLFEQHFLPSKANLSISSHGTETARTPLPLVIHLTIYGFTFGILHTLGGKLATTSYSINIPCCVAGLVVALILGALIEWTNKGRSFEIWPIVRSVVFPLTLIGVLITPMVSFGHAAVAVMESGSLLYNIIFFLGCVSLMKKTYVQPALLVAKGVIFKNLGMIAGIVLAIGAPFKEIVPNSYFFSIFAILVVLLLSAATFWIATDNQVRKLWGLRKNLSPKQYNNAVLKLKCEKLADEHGLTAREHETLTYIAQGKRAAEITRDQHVSINTVRSHIQHVYTKLGVHSLDELNELMKTIAIDDKEIE